MLCLWLGLRVLEDNVEIKFFIIIDQYFFWVVAHDAKKVIVFIAFQFS